MGLYDQLRCEAPLPRTREPLPEGAVFQTKDTPDQALTHYVLGVDGLMREDLGAGGGLFEEREPGAARRLSEPLPLHRMIAFYHTESLSVLEGVDSAVVGRRGWLWWEYEARFAHGLCEAITLVRHERHEPGCGTVDLVDGLPPSAGEDTPDLERRSTALAAALARTLSDRRWDELDGGQRALWCARTRNLMRLAAHPPAGLDEEWASLGRAQAIP